MLARLEAYEYWKRCSYITIRRLQSNRNKNSTNTNNNGSDSNNNDNDNDDNDDDSDDDDVQPDFMTTNIDSFLDQVIGKPYKFKVSDIFQSKYTSKGASLSATIPTLASSLSLSSSSSSSPSTTTISRKSLQSLLQGSNNNNNNNNNSSSSSLKKDNVTTNRISEVSDNCKPGDEVSSTYFCSQVLSLSS